ncbi:glycosyltransferase family 4 protein [Acidobacteriota bacterium]
MMRIIIDARTFVQRTRTGIGNHIRDIIPRIVELADDIQFTIIQNPKGRIPSANHKNIREIIVPFDTMSLYTVFRPGLGASLSDFDLFHSPSDMIPPGLRCPSVVTIHDLMWIEAPKLASRFPIWRWPRYRWYKATFGYAIRKSSAIIAISKATADALQRNFPDQAHKVHVIHSGIDHERFNPERAEKRSALDPWIPRETRYSMAVGKGSPYKNHANIVRAFIQATHDQPDHKLVLIRRSARIDLEMWKLCAQADVKNKVIILPYVDDKKLRTFYRHAQMLLFISQYEGFGMPVFEAMAMGIPVLTSNAPALLEISGNAALHAKSEDLSDMAEKIRLLDTDKVLRDKLIAAGQEHIRQYTWSKCARETLDVYRKTISKDL